ncbi:MAG: hypothetical protein K2J73_02675, partial [Oscillospiraceae bacterium]|nr:hypothetical protein [Oscillospiraceae bacterium]
EIVHKIFDRQLINAMLENTVAKLQTTKTLLKIGYEENGTYAFSAYWTAILLRKKQNISGGE